MKSLEEKVIDVIRHGGSFSHRNITVKQTDGRTELFIGVNRLYYDSRRYEAISLYGIMSRAAQKRVLSLLHKVNGMPVHLRIQGDLCQYEDVRTPGTWHDMPVHALLVYDKKYQTVCAYLG